MPACSLSVCTSSRPYCQAYLNDSWDDLAALRRFSGPSPTCGTAAVMEPSLNSGAGSKRTRSAACGSDGNADASMLVPRNRVHGNSSGSGPEMMSGFGAGSFAKTGLSFLQVSWHSLAALNEQNTSLSSCNSTSISSHEGDTNCRCMSGGSIGTE